LSALSFFRETLKPAGYLRRGKLPPFFEGWYFELADTQKDRRYAIIPGIYLAEEKANSQAFIQVQGAENLLEELVKMIHARPG
jgi:hypothetical protein